MKKYQFVEIESYEENTAAGKAPSDIKQIAEELGYVPLKIIGPQKNSIIKRITAQIKYKRIWNEIYNKIEKNSIILYQYPSYTRELYRIKVFKKLYRIKNVKFIFLIHDLNELRGVTKTKSGLLALRDIDSVAHKIIVHNESMSNYVQSLGVEKNKIVNLQIFDYLQSLKEKLPAFENSINIAGNLDVKKSGYVYKLNTIPIPFTLYGPNYNGVAGNNIHYKGVLPSDKIPNVLNKGFGLIWDGDSLTKCTGLFGKYLKYNNPHKLSLYLSSGLPVIIWDQAAEAEFIRKNKIGLTVRSLEDLPKIMKSISKDEYNKLAENVRQVSKKLTSGYYTKLALETAEKE